MSPESAGQKLPRKKRSMGFGLMSLERSPSDRKQAGGAAAAKYAGVHSTAKPETKSRRPSPRRKYRKYRVFPQAGSQSRLKNQQRLKFQSPKYVVGVCTRLK